MAVTRAEHARTARGSDSPTPQRLVRRVLGHAYAMTARLMPPPRRHLTDAARVCTIFMITTLICCVLLHGQHHMQSRIAAPPDCHLLALPQLHVAHLSDVPSFDVTHVTRGGVSAHVVSGCASEPSAEAVERHLPLPFELSPEVRWSRSESTRLCRARPPSECSSEGCASWPYTQAWMPLLITTASEIPSSAHSPDLSDCGGRGRRGKQHFLPARRFHPTAGLFPEPCACPRHSFVCASLAGRHT